MIHMLQTSNIEYAIGNENIAEEMENISVLPVFSPIVESFLDAFSQLILHDSEAKEYPDVITLGFWSRKASLRKMAERYADMRHALGRGVVFHIAPSNVAVNFAYSFIAALLAGNGSIIRLPSKPFRQVDLICRFFSDALKRVPQLRPYMLFIRYGHEAALNDRYSLICSTRVIWGGDHSIKEIRQSPLSPRANEITFSDRHSLALIHADEYLRAEDKERIAANFYNDTYLTDQNACSSPRIVIWMGDEVERAKKEFWQHLHQIVAQKYDFQAIQAVDKLAHLYQMGAAYPIKKEQMPDNYITRVAVEALDGILMDYKMNSGFFMEYHAERINEILPLCDQKCQTVIYYGIDGEQVFKVVSSNGIVGVDRIVPLGKSMDFSLVWDGVDLIRSMSREIAVK